MPSNVQQVLAALHAAAGGGGGPPFLDSLSPTGAWSASRAMLTSFVGSRYTTATGVDVLTDQTGLGSSRNFVQPTTANQPTITTDVVEALSFDGSNDKMSTTAINTDFISASSGYMIVSIKPTGFPTDDGTFYINSPVLQDNGQNTGITVRANGGSPLIYAGNYPQVVQSSIVANTKYVVEWRHEGGTLYQRINGAGEVSVASGNSATFSAVMNMGGLTNVYQGLIYEAAMFTTIPNLAARDALVQAMGLYVGASV